MNQIIWTTSAIADLKRMAERRALRIRREVDLALPRFGRALIRNVGRVSGVEGVHVLQRGGLRAFFQHNQEVEVVTILRAEDLRTDRTTGQPQRAAKSAKVTVALNESLIGLAKEETERAWLGETGEQVFAGRLAALALGDYLRERGIDRVSTETGYMTDPLLVALLGIAEADVAGVSVGISATLGDEISSARISRAAFDAGFVSDWYVFAQVAEDLSSLQFLGFVTDEQLECKATDQQSAPNGSLRWSTYEVELDELCGMAELESELMSRRIVQEAVEWAPLAAEASNVEKALTSAQLGEQLFGEMAHEQAQELHSAFLKAALEDDEERPYLGHIFCCGECRTDLFSITMLRDELEELYETVGQAPTGELAVAEPHPLLRRIAPEAVRLAPMEEGVLVVAAKTPLARLTNAVARTLSASWSWAREHPVPATATSVAFAATVLLILSMFLKSTEVKQQQLRRARTPYAVKVTAESKPGTPLEKVPLVVTVSNAQDQALYTESFPAKTGVAVYENPVDLNGDSYLEVVFALGSRENPALTGRVHVYSFDEPFLTGQRDRPLAAPPFNTYHQLSYSYFPTPWSGQSIVDKLTIDDPLQDGKPKIALIWRDALYAGSALTVLSLPGKVEEGMAREAEYIHPGYIEDLMIALVGGEKKILIAGVNNALRGTQLPFGQSDQYYPFIALLNPHQIWGEAPPYLRNEQAKGSHEWYGYFTPTGFRLRAPRLVDADGQTEILIEVASVFNPAYPAPAPYTAFYLDPAGRLIKEEVGDFPPPKKATYQLYDSSKIWWLGKEEYERRYAQAQQQQRR